MNSKLSAYLLLFSLIFTGQAEARIYDDMVASGVMKVAFYRDFPPYSFLQGGESAGVDVDLAKKLADHVGVKFEAIWVTPDESLEDDLRNYVWKGHYLDKDENEPFHQKNIADLMMRVPYDREFSYRQDSTGAVVNEQVVMFAPYQAESWRIAFDQSKLEKVSTLAVFQYHPIGVEVDSLPSFYMTSAFNGRMRKQVHHFPTLAAAYGAMHEGKVTAVMGMQGEVEWLLHQDADERYKRAENGFPMMGKQTWDIGMAVAQDNRQLAYALEEKIEQMIRSGEMAELFAQYGLSYKTPDLYQVQ